MYLTNIILKISFEEDYEAAPVVDDDEVEEINILSHFSSTHPPPRS